jgi:AraC-like DNA-binding protein
MSALNLTKRRGGPPLIDPAVFACWRQVDAWAGRLRSARLVRAREAAMAPGFAGQVHAVPTLVCCLRGTARIALATRGVDLAAGEAAMIAPGAWHAHPPLKPGSMVYAQGLLARRSDVLLITPERRCWLMISAAPAETLLARAMTASDQQARLHAVQECIASFAREPAEAWIMREPEQRMAGYLWSNFTQPIRPGDILRASGLSRAQAHQVFRGCFGETPLAALTSARLTLASHLEVEGFDPQAIAQRCGFPSLAHWRRCQRRTRAQAAR